VIFRWRRTAGDSLRDRFVWVVFEGETNTSATASRVHGAHRSSGPMPVVQALASDRPGVAFGGVSRIAARANGCPTGFPADVVATAKRDLKPSEILDGEGGYTVVGSHAGSSFLRIGGLPPGSPTV